METYTLSQFPSPWSQVHIAVFRDVTNAPDIRKRLIRASTLDGPEGDAARAEVDFGFIEGRLIVSKEHLMVAILTTLLLALPSSFPPAPSPTSTSTPTTLPTPKTRSHNLHSEILLTLSPNNNISDSIRRHGLSDSTDFLVVVHFGEGQPEGIWRQIDAVVKGELVHADELDQGEEVDWGKVDKIYKLSELNRLPLPSSEILEKKVAAVINTVAVKSVT